MTQLQKEKLAKAKKEALKNPPKELKEIVLETKRSKIKKSSHQILMEMRYGSC